ncbi:hypothetical protein QL093DRAFT_2587216 [Fusarium oxysporum]|nr:hypothetical protein QL093DRAFT_2587216 [Fusarium oxysporum]
MRELDAALYTIAWIAPLEIEAQAARHMLDNRHDGRFPISRGDDYVFLAGDINGHNIVIATLPPGQEYGTGSAAALASQIKKFFTNLWFGLFVGVAAGLPNLRNIPPIDIRLGDVLVGLSEGDKTSEGFQLLRFGQVLANTETVVRSAIGNIKIRAPGDTDVFLPFYERIKDKEHSRGTFADPGQEKDIFYDIGDDGVDSPVQRMQRPTDRRTRVWYGSIGSGDKLTKNTLKRNEIRDRYGVIGLEMEAAGTMNRIPIGVIRGVCDYADQHKNKEWQPYAAAMAAAYAKAVIYELGLGKVMPSSSMMHEAKHALCGTILCDLPPTTDRFFGRKTELLEMVKCLEAITQRRGVVLCGISGSGKTQLARQYVAQRSGSFSAILWIDASSEESIEESFSSCSSRIHEHNPEFRAGRESTPSRQLVLEWLRTTPEKNWLTVIDNANGPIPNKRLLGPFQDINHGSLCIISTNQVTARALRLKHILIEHLDARASQSLLLWRAYENDAEYEEDVSNAAWHAAKLLGGFPLALELAGVLHHRGITALDEFAETFTNDYPELAQFEIDSGVWIWTRNGAINSLFSMLDSLYASILIKSTDSALLITFCSIYGPFAIPISLVYNLDLIDVEDTEKQGPWKQLQTLVQSKIKLNMSIDELNKVFLATKKQASDHTLLSFSLHASICQWRLATMEDRDVWIIQATYSLSKHILSLHNKCDAFRFFNLFNRSYFTICLCGGDVYLAMGKSEIARTLFTSAIDYIRSSSLSDPDDKIFLQLLCGLAKSCENTREFEMAEEALLSASTISERLNGHMNDQTVSLVSRLKAVRDHMLTELENRKRALVACTGPKLAPAVNSDTKSSMEFENEELYRQMIEKISARGGLDSLASSSGSTTATTLPNLAWELRFSHPILVFSLQDDGNDLSGFPDAFPITIRGSMDIMAYENIDIKSIHIQIDVSGMSVWNVEGRRKGKQLFGDGADFTTWKLKLCDSNITSDGRFGDNCTFRLDNENSQENTRQPESDGVAKPDHIPFPPGSYSYPFESTVDFSDSNPHIPLMKELPVIQIPRQLRPRSTATNQSLGQQNEGISFCVDLPYKISPIGGRIPITVTLGPVNNDLRAEYLTYTIVQRGKRWTQDRATQKTDEQKLVLLERFILEESTRVGDDDSSEQYEEEAAFSCESDESCKTLFVKGYLPNLDPDDPVSISDDLMLPTCKQMKAGWLVGQEPLELTCSTPFIELNHFIQVTVGGSRLDSDQSESRILETIEKIPIAIIDYRITHRSDLLVDSMAHESSPTNNRTATCGCPDAYIYEECLSWDKTPPTNRPINATLLTETSLYTREVHGGSEDDVRHKNTRLEEAWSQPIQGPSKPQHWEVVRDRSRNSSMSEHSIDEQTSDLHTAEDTLQSFGFTTDPRDEPPPYSD